MFETKSGILLIAGIGFFTLAFVGNGLVPILLYKDLPEQTAEELVNQNLLTQFEELARRYPDGFKKYIGEPTKENCAETLRLGRKIYVGEACWHCHSQFVRPVSNEERRWGQVPRSAEYQNELQRPVMFGTRRVGPDLSREAGRRSSDWHATHFFDPKLTSPETVMPTYPWFFDGSPDKPNRRGLAVITYIQWLGSWLEKYPYYVEDDLVSEE